jgi:hypothetical protein
VKLRREVEKAKAATQAPAVREPSQAELDAEYERGWEDALGEYERMMIGARDHLESVAKAVRAGHDAVCGFVTTIVANTKKAINGRRGGARTGSGQLGSTPRGAGSSVEPRPVADSAPPAVRRADGPSDNGLMKGARTMLEVLASRHPTPLTKTQLSTLAGLKPTGGTFRTYLSALSVEGYVRREGDLTSITAAGLTAAGPVPTPKTAKELVSVWREKLEGKAKDMLEFLAAADRAITKQEIADQLGLDIKGGTFRTYLSKLTANGLVTRERGMFRIAAALAL